MTALFWVAYILGANLRIDSTPSIFCPPDDGETVVTREIPVVTVYSTPFLL